jgi:hypoxanthine phosphoribosyltransferase
MLQYQMQQGRLFKRFRIWLISQGEREIDDLGEMRQRLDNMFGTAKEKSSWVIDTIDELIHERDFDIVVSKERKGSNLFERYLSANAVTDIHHVRFDLMKPDEINGSKVLVFDDGIHYGNTIRKIIQRLRKYGAANIKVRAIISDEETFKKISREFPMVDFDSALKVHSEDYTRTYNLTFYRIFDQQYSPLDSHLEFTVHIRGINELDDLTQAFQISGGEIYWIPTLEQSNLDIIKGTIYFQPSQIQHDQSFPACNIEMYKIRFYLRDKGTHGIRILFTPIVHLGNIDLDNCKKDFDGCNRICSSPTAKSLEEGDFSPCLECYEYRVTTALFKTFEVAFLSKLKEKRVEIIEPSKDWNLARKYGLQL